MTSYARLLGVPQFRLGETWHDPPFAKARALLFYLVYRGDWVSRDELLYLLYPATPEQPARANLRQLLASLRKLPYSEGLETEDTRLRWQTETDVASFNKAIAEEKWAKALELYRGELLHGFNPHDMPEVDNWLSLERQTLHSAWRKATLNLADELENSERSRQAADLLAQLHKADVLDEEVLRAYLESLYRSHQRTTALEIFEDFIKTLRREVGGEPESVTLKLIERIEREEPLLKERGKVAVTTLTVTEHPARVESRSHLPPQATPFVGREKDKEGISELLNNLKCRLLTITGPGGIGKTRLALEVAEGQESFQDGVHFVSLAALSAPDFIISTLASALKFTFYGPKAPKEQLLEYLRDKQVLLLLDNFEHLLDGATLASDLLSACPKLKLLVTSRERLNLKEEWGFVLEGLAVPSENSSLVEAQYYDALRLFLERAKQARLDFELTPEELPHAISICKMVQGLPLGIELAAAWVKLLSCQEIVQEMAQPLDFLSSSTRNVPEQHRSIRAVFEHSWRLLAPAEQEVLGKLSVFRGGFTREAAAVVADAPIAVLAALLDKSLLRLSDDGRYDRHPLLYQYTQEKLSEQPEKEQRYAKHASYYLALAEEAAPHLTGARQVEWLDRLEAEHTNLRAALAHFIGLGNAEKSLRFVTAVRWFWEMRGYFSEGLHWLEATLKVEGGVPPILKARALNAAGVFAWRLSNFDAAKRLVEQALSIRRDINDQTGIAGSLRNLGNIAADRAEYTEARRLYEESLASYRAVGDDLEVAASLSLLGTLAVSQGEFERCQAIYTDALAILHKLGDTQVIAFVLGNLTVVRLWQGDYGLAQTSAREYLELGKVLGNRTVIARALKYLGKLAQHGGDYPTAQQHYQESLTLLRDLGQPMEIASTLGCLGELALDRNDIASARSFTLESLELDRRAGYKVGIAATLNLLGVVTFYEKNYLGARQHLEESVSLSRAVQDKRSLACALLFLGKLARMENRNDEAKGFLKESLQLVQAAGLKPHLPLLLEAWAAFWGTAEQTERSVQLYGAAAYLRESLGMPLAPVALDAHEQELTALRARMNKWSFEAAWQDGRKMGPKRAISHALEEGPTEAVKG